MHLWERRNLSRRTHHTHTCRRTEGSRSINDQPAPTTTRDASERGLTGYIPDSHHSSPTNSTNEPAATTTATATTAAINYLPMSWRNMQQSRHTPHATHRQRLSTGFDGAAVISLPGTQTSVRASRGEVSTHPSTSWQSMERRSLCGNSRNRIFAHANGGGWKLEMHHYS